MSRVAGSARYVDCSVVIGGIESLTTSQLTSLITHRYKFPADSVSLYAAKVQSRGLSAVAQCESLRYKLLNGLAVRRACYGVLRYAQTLFLAV